MSLYDRLTRFLFLDKTKAMKSKDTIVEEINKFEFSSKRLEMLKSSDYFEGLHDILLKKRTAIGRNGELKEIPNLPNNKLIDNQYRKMVIQKKNYLVGKPFILDCDNKTYMNELTDIFNKHFYKVLNQVVEDSIVEGIGWMYVGYNEVGDLRFNRIKNHEIIPIWADKEHETLKGAIRFYYTNENDEKVYRNIEIYTLDGIYYCNDKMGVLTFDKFEPYITANNVGFGWDKLPLIPFKFNGEVPLLNKVKALQDSINYILSDFQDKLEQDPHNSILILKNYDGEDLGEFRENLRTYGAIKVSTADGMEGGLDSLEVKVDNKNFEFLLKQLRKALIENANGYDINDERVGKYTNQMNLQSIYNDIDLDANEMELEYQDSMKKLLWFINCYLQTKTGISYFEEKVNIIFDRDMMMNESELIQNILQSQDLSLETRLANHPFVKDVDVELQRIKKEQELYDFEGVKDNANQDSNDEDGKEEQ